MILREGEFIFVFTRVLRSDPQSVAPERGGTVGKSGTRTFKGKK
jgi:hypothetical protein